MARHPDWAHYHQNKTSQTHHEAQVSLPYSVCRGVERRAALLKQYTDRKLKDPVLRAHFRSRRHQRRCIAAARRVVQDDHDDERRQRFVSQIDYPKGSIQNSMSDAELRTKFDTLATPVIGEAHAAQLAELIAGVEQVSDIGKLMRLTAKPKRTARK